MNPLGHRFERVRNARVLVVGDIMLDRYTWGNASRVSPEAPVLVLRAEEEEVRLGGAANVACLLRHLGARVSLAGVVGDDPGGRTVRRLMDEIRIRGDGVLIDPDRCTTTKERLVGRAAGRHPHQILRVDRETTHALGEHLERHLLSKVGERPDEFQAVLVSDYAKGVCTPSLLASLIREARARGIPVLVDPARVDDYDRYRGAAVLTPNRAEAERATGMRIASASDAFAAGERLCRWLELDGVLLTLDKDGIVVVARDHPPEIVPTRRREVYDITGAGDMVLAVAGLCQAAGFALAETAALANAAAGLEIERLGVSPVAPQEILAELNEGASGKLVTLEEIAALADGWRRDGKTIVFTNGCFDLLHMGHVTYLQQAAQLGDLLVVAINSDASVRRLKGPERPIICQGERAAMLASLSCIDHVLVFEEDTPHRVLEQVRPDVLVKGGTTRTVVGGEIVARYGGKVRILDGVPEVSTTTIVSRIREASCV